MQSFSYRTQGGITVHRQAVPQTVHAVAIDALVERLDRRRGVLLSSSFEFPGRYTRWDIGFTDPPVMLTSRSDCVTLTALNERGAVLLQMMQPVLQAHADVRALKAEAHRVILTLNPPARHFPEEERSRQPSVFSILRALNTLFSSAQDHHLGLYGAFGYDLVFQFENVPRHLSRDADQRDLVLYLPDEIRVIDHKRETAALYRYDFEAGGHATTALPRDTAEDPFRLGQAGGPTHSDFGPGEYAAMVERAREAFARGDMFEAVLSQTFSAPCADAPSTLFRRLRQANPAPYGALMNLGDGEFLVAASPEMFVRVEGRRIETCPLSGTIRRGRNALEDAENIRKLLNSRKDESELTMCTDVDRNDKSRVCEPGSVKVIGRRQIEMYSRLMHTADHVEGCLRPEFDALDGFLSHAWAVTVTGAPKLWAIRHIEAEERSPRRWYGGAIGAVTFNGNMNTGLTLRTIRVHGGMAEVRAGATLLHDSDPEAEEAECRLKASALLAVIRGETAAAKAEAAPPAHWAGRGKHVLLVDHEDSFVHTLAGYYRATGARVTTMRHGMAREALAAGSGIDLVVLSPGAGRPRDFDLNRTLSLLVEKRLPVFGVCLGLQGIVEHFGGRLEVLHSPMHGKPSRVTRHGDGSLMRHLPESFTVGRYHSLHGATADFPEALAVTARSEDGVIMAVEHRDLPIAAVQFHPESLMTSPDEIGMPLIAATLELGDAAQMQKRPKVAASH